MVKEDTHLFFAEKVLARLSPRSRKLVKEQRAYYDLGSVLPDAFFYWKRTAPVGDVVHGKAGELTNNVIFSVLDRLKKEPHDRTLALLYGYLTHVAFDSVFHPVIHYFSGAYDDSEKRKRLRARYLHRQLETALQQRFAGMLLPQRSELSLIDDTLFPEAFAEEYNVPKEWLRKALRKQKRFFLTSNNPFIYSLYRVFARLGLADWSQLSSSYRNLAYETYALNERFTYQEPFTGELNKTTIKDLVEEGLKRSLAYIMTAERYVSGAISKKQAMQVIDGVSLDSGKRGVSLSAARHFSKAALSFQHPLKRFVNEDGEPHAMPSIRVLGYIWRRMSLWRRAARKKEHYRLPRAKPDLKAKGDLLIWLGHSSFLLKVEGKWLLIDPVLTKLFGVLRLNDPPLKAEEVLAIDYLLISHGHVDHLDKRTIQHITVQNALIPLRMGKAFKKKKGTKIQEASWYQEYDLDEHFTITFLPALHYHRRTLFDSNNMLWGSFLIQWRNKKLFFCGDSGYALHFKEIGRRYGPIDYCLMPIAAYAPAWLEGKTHMTPEESLKAFKDLKGKLFIPMHYGTFDLSDEPLAEPLERLQKARRTEKIKILQLGENLKL